MLLGYSDHDRRGTGLTGFFSEKIAQKLNPWNPVNPVQFFFLGSQSRK
jgi:hypothetical protein